MLRADMHIYIDNLTYENNTVTHNLSDIIEYVTQYRFQGGPEQPVRYLEMKVDKNDIDEAHPDLIDSIVEGKTRVLVNAVDGGTFIITKIWLKENSYDLVATGIEITLNTATLSAEDVTALSGISDPPAIVYTLFNRWKDTLDLSTDQSDYEEGSPAYDDDFEIYFSNSYAGANNHTPRTTPVNQITFKENMPTLVAINMCALLDNAFVFFADNEGVNTLFYVSYDDINPLAFNPADDDKNGVVNIYPGLTSQYVNYSKFDLMMFQRLIGISSKNSEGSETIVNNQIVSMEDGEGTAYSDKSMAIYGDYAGTKVMSDLMVSYDWYVQYSDYTSLALARDYIGYWIYDGANYIEVTEDNYSSLGITAGTTVAYEQYRTANIIAKNIVRRYKDPTRSITFTLSEVINDSATGTSGWEGQIPPFSYAYKIYDSVNRIRLENKHLCDNTTDNFMLRLSTFIRAYPEMTTEYTFGVMKETTLSQELANKLTGMSGNVADIRVNGTSIVKNGIITADTVPSLTTQNPDHLITSHGTYTAIDDLKTALLGAIYPVGAIYMNVSGTLPSLISGLGIWVKIAEGQVLLSAGSTYTSGTEYGANTKTITKDHLPEHTHSLSDHHHSISNGGWGQVVFGPIVLEGTSTGVSGAVKKYGTMDTSVTGWVTESYQGDNNTDDSVASSGSGNKSRWMNIQVDSHNHGGSTGDAGSGNTGNNTTDKDALDVMQKSLAVHMWRRTA